MTGGTIRHNLKEVATMSENTPAKEAAKSAAPAERKQISVSLTPEQAEQFVTLQFETRELRASNVLLAAVRSHAKENGVSFD